MLKALRGTRDILPKDAALWQMIETGARELFHEFGYSEIRTPIIEEKSLFVKSVGDQSDIVTKEMFSFTDRGERDVALRPEGTAPIVRAYLEANLHKTEPLQKFYYIGPMFRAERPQAGRLRQFHQIGAEAVGSLDPSIDAEIILLLTKILDKVKIENYKLRMNNLGCRNDKAKLSKVLRERLSGEKAALCEDCKKRLDTNALRILDCKNDSCRNTAHGAFKSIDFLCKECVAHFDEVLSYLDLAKVKYSLDPYIVRGLDYYTGTVFEVSHQSLGAQDAIGAGGRYDNLINDLGGPNLGATGFALGVERILLAAAKQGAVVYQSEESEAPKVVYIATIGKNAHKKGFELVSELRNYGIKKLVLAMDHENKSLKAQMREADKLKAGFVLIIGDDEIKKEEAVLRDMKTKEQLSIKFNGIVALLKARL